MLMGLEVFRNSNKTFSKRVFLEPKIPALTLAPGRQKNCVTPYAKGVSPIPEINENMLV